jgi:hypothetical protein
MYNAFEADGVTVLDCDDADSGVNPGATDIPGDGIDQDCVGGDAGAIGDGDGDGVDGAIDCDDNDPTSYPAHCDDGVSADQATCEGSGGWDTGDTGVPTVGVWIPAADDIPNDGIDQDCDGADYTACCYTLNMVDSWGDGWNGNALELLVDGVSEGTFTIPTGLLASEEFCVDSGSVFELTYSTAGSYASEMSYELLDYSGSSVADAGTFTFGTSIAVGDSLADGACGSSGIDDDNDGADSFYDCDDNDPTVGDFNYDMDCDGILTIDDCDDYNDNPSLPAGNAGGAIADDADCDGFVGVMDCGPNDATIYPFAPEIPNDGIDQDCDGSDLIGSGNPCEYVLTMNDSWGDGWNGGHILAYANGAAILSGLPQSSTMPADSFYAEFGSTTEVTFSVNSSEILTLDYVAGSFESENEYILTDNLGNILFTDGPTPLTTVLNNGPVFSVTCP